MDEVQRGKYRKRLEQEYRELRALLLSQSESEREAEDCSPEDILDQAARSYTNTFRAREGESRHAQLQLVKEALARLDSDAFGVCLNCGHAIGPGRLDAVPWARFCRACQEREELLLGESENGSVYAG